MISFKQKTAYEMRISDWSSDVCSSDLIILYALQETIARGAIEIREHTRADFAIASDGGEDARADIEIRFQHREINLHIAEALIARRHCEIVERRYIEIGRAHV